MEPPKHRSLVVLVNHFLDDFGKSITKLSEIRTESSLFLFSKALWNDCGKPHFETFFLREASPTTSYVHVCDYFVQNKVLRCSDSKSALEDVIFEIFRFFFIRHKSYKNRVSSGQSVLEAEYESICRYVHHVITKKKKSKDLSWKTGQIFYKFVSQIYTRKPESSIDKCTPEQVLRIMISFSFHKMNVPRVATVSSFLETDMHVLTIYLNLFRAFSEGYFINRKEFPLSEQPEETRVVVRSLRRDRVRLKISEERCAQVFEQLKKKSRECQDLEEECEIKEKTLSELEEQLGVAREKSNTIKKQLAKYIVERGALGNDKKKLDDALKKKQKEMMDVLKDHVRMKESVVDLEEEIREITLEHNEEDEGRKLIIAELKKQFIKERNEKIMFRDKLYKLEMAHAEGEKETQEKEVEGKVGKEDLQILKDTLESERKNAEELIKKLKEKEDVNEKLRVDLQKTLGREKQQSIEMQRLRLQRLQTAFTAGVTSQVSQGTQMQLDEYRETIKDLQKKLDMKNQLLLQTVSESNKTSGEKVGSLKELVDELKEKTILQKGEIEKVVVRKETQMELLLKERDDLMERVKILESDVETIKEEKVKETKDLEGELLKMELQVEDGKREVVKLEKDKRKLKIKKKRIKAKGKQLEMRVNELKEKIRLNESASEELDEEKEEEFEKKCAEELQSEKEKFEEENKKWEKIIEDLNEKMISGDVPKEKPTTNDDSFDDALYNEREFFEEEKRLEIEKLMNVIEELEEKVELILEEKRVLEEERNSLIQRMNEETESVKEEKEKEIEELKIIIGELEDKAKSNSEGEKEIEDEKMSIIQRWKEEKKTFEEEKGKQIEEMKKSIELLEEKAKSNSESTIERLKEEKVRFEEEKLKEFQELKNTINELKENLKEMVESTKKGKLTLDEEKEDTVRRLKEENENLKKKLREETGNIRNLTQVGRKEMEKCDKTIKELKIEIKLLQNSMETVKTEGEREKAQLIQRFEEEKETLSSEKSKEVKQLEEIIEKLKNDSKVEKESFDLERKELLAKYEEERKLYMIEKDNKVNFIEKRIDQMEGRMEKGEEMHEIERSRIQLERDLEVQIEKINSIEKGKEVAERDLAEMHQKYHIIQMEFIDFKLMMKKKMEDILNQQREQKEEFEKRWLGEVDKKEEELEQRFSMDMSEYEEQMKRVIDAEKFKFEMVQTKTTSAILSKLELTENRISTLQRNVSFLKVQDSGRKNEFASSVDQFNEAREKIAELQFNDINEIYSYLRPKPIVFDVVRCVLLLLGKYKPVDLVSWMDCKKKMKTRFLKDVQAFVPNIKTNVRGIRTLCTIENKQLTKYTSKAVSTLFLFLESILNVVEQLKVQGGGITTVSVTRKKRKKKKRKAVSRTLSMH